MRRLAGVIQYSGPTLTKQDLLEIRLASIAAIQDPHTGGYSYAIEVKVTGGFAPGPPAESAQACERQGYIGVECVHGHQTTKIVRCRNCQGCRLNWLGRVRRLILDGSEGWPTWMWTLTFKEYPTDMKGENRFDFAQAAWNKLRRKAARRHITMRYLRVVELQERGTPHFHLATNRWTHRGRYLNHTHDIDHLARGLAQSAGFGTQMDVQKARLGAAGVASYLADYLKKSEDYFLMRRDDGRAIRRYNRSHGWGRPLDLPSWRFTALPRTFSYQTQPTPAIPCTCGQGLTLPRRLQAHRWLERSRSTGSWMAPLSVADYFLKGEDLT